MTWSAVTVTMAGQVGDINDKILEDSQTQEKGNLLNWDTTCCWNGSGTFAWHFDSAVGCHAACLLAWLIRSFGIDFWLQVWVRWQTEDIERRCLHSVRLHTISIPFARWMDGLDNDFFLSLIIININSLVFLFAVPRPSNSAETRKDHSYFSNGLTGRWPGSKLDRPAGLLVS